MRVRGARGLLSWLDDPAADRGMSFARPDGSWERRSYVEIAELTSRFTGALAKRGIGRGTVVSVLLGPGPDAVAALFGVLAAGATPSPVVPPLTLGDVDAYAGHLVHVVTAARAAVVVTETRLLPVVERALGGAREVMVLTAGELAEGGDGGGPRHSPELALVQFTSGSSGRARPVAVPSGALEGMIESIRRWLEMDGSGETVSWLPIQHDMGLIGCLLTPVVDASDVALMAPEAFLRRPSRYLERLSGGVRRSALPGFAIDTLSRTVAPADVARLDLSGWRTLVVGAQRLDPGGIERFCGLLEPAGFDRRAVLPAYGLAEATLAVTGLPLRASWSHVSVRASSLAAGRRVEPASAGEDAVDVIGCGVPLEGVGVTVTAGGAELEPGTVGEIVVRGASVASYLDGGRSPSLTTFVDGALHTGDAGFLLDGQLFVLGRFGDSVKVRGTMLFAETVEAALVALGIPPHRVVALLGNRAGVPAVVALLERPRDGDTARAEAVLRRSAGGASTQVLEVPRGTIARTSSGKPRRRELWQAFVEDRLPGA